MRPHGERAVLVDMDGVLADFEAPNNAIVRKFFPNVRPVYGRTDFYYKDTYKDYPVVVAKIESEVRRPGFIRSFEMFDGAENGWMRILEAGYTPVVCSSPLENHETIIAEKKEWLEEYLVPSFGMSVVDDAIFDRDKSGYDAIAVIDDRPTVRGADKALWQHILFDASYNETIDTGYRLYGWYDHFLENYLDLAQARYLHMMAIKPPTT